MPAERLASRTPLPVSTTPFTWRAQEILWRELGSGNLLRWIGQHQGGYPVEFYPLGEAWLEVVVRAVSLGSLPAEGSHTLAIIGLFLRAGGGVRRFGPARMAGLRRLVSTAFALHISDSRVAGTTADTRTGAVGPGDQCRRCGGRALHAAGDRAVSAHRLRTGLVRLRRALAAMAIYCNPRSMLALVALGSGAWLRRDLRNGAITILRGQVWVEIHAT